MNLQDISIIIPTEDIMYKTYISRYEDYYEYEYSYEECDNKEWSTVFYEILNDYEILNNVIKNGEELYEDMNYIIDSRLFSSNFETHFENIKDTIILGIDTFLTRKKKNKYNKIYNEAYLLNKINNIRKLTDKYYNMKKIWWN